MSNYVEYRTMSAVPGYHPINRDDDGNVLNRDELKWGGPYAVPAIGSEIIVTINNCGPGKVTGYFQLDGYLGLLVVLSAPPQWYIRQNGGASVEGHTFGTEFHPA